jgi:serine/threonine protein kinase/WD40 repeat protein
VALTAGTRLGPYEIRGLLGAGGMGEVYRACDPRLGREVAVKVLPEDVAREPERLQRFGLEARAVAALNHPNILTVYDVGTHESVLYVVTELLEGESLRELVSRRAPTQRQVLFFLAQAAHGLEAAHAKGIVHRDVKPENLFVTTDGRVKLLDFGLAKQLEGLATGSGEATESSPTGAGQVLGTVAYMSPEQVRGLPVDHRTDIYSLGALAYELLSGKHPFRRETTVATLTAILEETPSELTTLGRSVPPALSGIVQRCLEKDRGQRFCSAHDLALSFEAVLAAPAGAASLQEVEERSPYPGLRSFTEKDAAFFFGREEEVSTLWERLRSRHLSGVIGPSGAGKTSFVRAGVVASRPEGWGAIVSTPGVAPFRGLGQALVSQLAGDLEALERILSVDDPAVAFDLVSRWRKGRGEALLVVDQFEELFTLNPKEVQERFGAFLGRLAKDGGVHVLLSLRDDFLMKCADHDPLAKVFESLSPIPALSRDGLARALVEPARKRGYSFEDEALIGEMVDSVEGARGALPLLAFAVSRLWEKRDREKKLLTRAAYEEIGGVAGALAQHADTTLDRIGPGRQGMVREIFRTLVTSQGTRAVAEREAVLSLFPERKAAVEVLGALIDARLLTSYEVEGAEGQPSLHRVEIVHESLVKAWPRLVRWQAQDEEGAVLRDQLKQAAHLWKEKGRTSDLLWTGTAYQEYVLWRDRYAGALTALEEDFARAMAERAQRQRRLRRLVAGSVVSAAVVVAIVTGGLWRRSEGAREQAKAEALRAEAGKLLALGRNHLEADRTAALAYARASLDLFDTREARTFALEALWRGPVARLLPLNRTVKELRLPEDRTFIAGLALSPDGRWLATGRVSNRQIILFDREGGPPRALPRQPDGTTAALAFGPRSDLLVTGGSGRSLRLWSLPDLREVRAVELGGLRSVASVVRGDDLLVFTRTGPQSEGWPGVIQAIRLPDGEPRPVGTIRPGEDARSVDPTGTQVIFRRGESFGLRPLDARRERRLGSAARACDDVAFSPRGDRLAILDCALGKIRVQSLIEPGGTPVRVLHGSAYTAFDAAFTRFDPGGSRLTQAGPNNSIHLWELDAFPDARPAPLGRPAAATWHVGQFDPGGRWLVAANGGGTTIELWPVAGPRRRELRGHASNVGTMAFTADGRWLASCSYGEPLRLWPLRAADGSARDLPAAGPCNVVATRQGSDDILVVTTDARVFLSPLPGGPPRLLPSRGGKVNLISVAFDMLSRRALASPGGLAGIPNPTLRALRVWDLHSLRERNYSVAHLTAPSWGGYKTVAFAPDGSLYVGGQGGVRRLSLPADPGGTVSSEAVYAADSALSDLSQDGTRLLVWGGSGGFVPKMDLLLFDLAGHTSRRITTHGARLNEGRLSPSGRVIVTGDFDGVVRVGPVTGGEPHLLLGHQGVVTALAISPDEQWIASASDDALLVWPMPDVTKPPLHTLPHAELLAKLDALTNLRVVRDPSSSTGWKVDVGPFPGWKDVPTW